MPHTLPKRSDLPLEHTWDLASVFPSDDAWREAYAAVEAELPRLEATRGRRAESAAALLDWLRQSEAARERLGRVAVYASMQYDVDTGDSEAGARYQQVIGLYARFGAACAGASTEIAGVGRETLDRFQQEEPGLVLYAHYFDVLLREREHLRSGEVEEVLALANDSLTTPWLAVTGLTDADLRFGKVTDSAGQSHDVGQGTIDGLLENREREVRRKAWEQYADGYLSVKNTLAALLSGSVKSAVFEARVRRYASARDAALSRNHIPVEVFQAVTTAFREHLPLWHRYWRVRKRVLGVDRLHVYDIWAPLTASEPEVSYDDAVSWLVEGMRPLGDEYVEPMRRGLTTERWVDIYPNQGKRGGAYSGGSYGTVPFALMNWTGGMGWMSVLAHELGHSMHTYMSHKHQSHVYADYPIFLAEVASNFNQALVRAYLLETHADPHFQLSVLGETFSNFHRYLFIMPVLALFEDEIHRRAEAGEGLTADSLSALMLDLFREGYGGEVEIDAERIGITWAQFQHLYMNFYVYQYATGIAAANALAEPVLRGDTDAARRYLDFLKSGSSRYPLETLGLAGIDMASPEPLRAAYGVLERFVSRLEALAEQVSGTG